MIQAVRGDDSPRDEKEKAKKEEQKEKIIYDMIEVLPVLRANTESGSENESEDENEESDNNDSHDSHDSDDNFIFARFSIVKSKIRVLPSLSRQTQVSPDP